MDKERSSTILDSLSYLSDHAGFYGTIKNSSADFVVTEINVNGQLVTNDCGNRTEEFIKTNNDGDHHNRNQKQKIISKDVCDTSVIDNSTSGTESDPNNYLDNTVNESETQSDNLHNCPLNLDIQESLNHFASCIKTTWKTQVDGDCAQELSLGLFPDKNKRATIHSAVRQTFPFLMTVTKCTEVLIKPNPEYRELCQLTSEEEADEFFKFLDAKTENSRFTFQPDDRKEHRTAVHHFINKKFGKLVETKSFSEKNTDGFQNVSITVRFREKLGSSRKRHRTEGTDPHNVYTAFTLQKENIETLDAISYMSSGLGVLPSDFSYAGIKDKKATTYQAMVVKKVTPTRLLQIESFLAKKGMKIYNVHSVNQPLRLGHLAGNHFSIIVRDVKNHSKDSSANVKERISEAIDSIKTKGFINYYGPQRFGQRLNCQSHDIGLALLKEEMETSVKLLFSPDTTEDPVNIAKQYFLKTEDAKGALALMPDCKIRERMLLRALNRYGMNRDGCIRGWLSIPHSMRIFYVHAYCSKIWNEATSYRFLCYGAKVVEGDLVLSDHNADEKSSLTDRVHVVTAAEESANTYSIQQVVLPMLGHSIRYPTNKVGQWYEETLATAGLQTCKFRVGALQLNLPGCYRHILKFPRNLSYELTLENPTKSEERINAEFVSTSTQCMRVTFELDLSCYATVCLREMMKCNF
ncbi:pseudouridylate synthase PUS7L [Bombina bombina]|uniref:pseudouridylate synthase PUS7L n=1 Tax=Bombina bombina TaxID=8345 RepID=UPI00235A83F3|nr:pseudouridylate synthase PUS7L [Bombina bombina]XP_053572709.1 pseudouridylate synthase PUS7L [Bombina bombina]